jgi:hypothetical protein
MMIAQTWRTPDGRWLVDSAFEESGVRYRVWDRGELAAEVPGGLDDLTHRLTAFGVDPGQLEPLPEGDDPDCE